MPVRTLAAALAASASLVATSPALAQPVSPAPPPPPRERSISLTVSPLHLLFPMLEVTGELRAGPRLGIAGIAGIGSVTAANAGGGDDVRFFAAEIGASVRYYLLGSFAKGMQVGGELLFVHVSVDESDNVQLSGAGQGLSLGPFVGYKWTGRSGFTFDGQGGLAIVAVRANASDGTSTSSSEQSRVYPLLNVNVGWSF